MQAQLLCCAPGMIFARLKGKIATKAQRHKEKLNLRTKISGICEIRGLKKK